MTSIAGRYGVTRAELREQTETLYAKAFLRDPAYVEQLTRAVTGHDAFAWDALSAQQFARLRAGLYIVVMA